MACSTVVRATEVPPPPGNISTRLEDTDLLVTWSLPKTGISKKPACFKYELDIGDGVQNGRCTRMEQVFSSASEWILLKTGTLQKYIGDAVLQGGEHGPRADLLGEDEGQAE